MLITLNFLCLLVCKTSVKGTFEIKGQGKFIFDGGKVVIGVDEKTNEGRLKICREINKAIFSMTEHLRNKKLSLTNKEELFS